MIFFNVDEVRDYLLKTGKVYTLRHKRKEGQDEAVKGNFPNHIRVATVMITRILKEEVIDPEQLTPYITHSGLYKTEEELLTTAKRWFTLAKELHKNEPLQLYAVTVIRR